MYTFDELRPWLGEVADELDGEQKEQFVDLVNLYQREIETQRDGYGTEEYLPEDYAEDNAAAWWAALEIATGMFKLRTRGRSYVDALTSAQQGAIMAVLAGGEEAPSSRDAGVSLTWLRKQFRR